MRLTFVKDFWRLDGTWSTTRWSSGVASVAHTPHAADATQQSSALVTRDYASRGLLTNGQNHYLGFQRLSFKSYLPQQVRGKQLKRVRTFRKACLTRNELFFMLTQDFYILIVNDFPEGTLDFFNTRRLQMKSPFHIQYYSFKAAYRCC